jgi:hypothetical protein
MAFCDRRGIELREGIERSPPPGMPAGDKELLLAAIRDWDAKRRKHLDELCLALREQDGTACANAWKTGVAGLRAGLTQFSGVLRNVSSPFEGSLQFVQGNAAADEKFITAIDAALVSAEARDYLVTYVGSVRVEASNLETKWSALLSQHASYQQQEAAVIEQVASIVNDAIARARDLDARMATLIADSLSAAKDLIQSLPEGLADGDGIPNNNELVAAGLAVDTFRALTTGIEDQRARFERYMRDEAGSVLFLFQDFRAGTQRFIETFGYKFALERAELADRALSDIVSNGGTSSGNKGDAEEFSAAARILLKGHVANAKNTWDDFVARHEAKFFGPVGPNFAKALLDRDLFESKYERLQASNLHELAERWRHAARTVWGVDFSGIPPHMAEAYRNALQAKPSAVGISIRSR